MIQFKLEPGGFTIECQRKMKVIVNNVALDQTAPLGAI